MDDSGVPIQSSTQLDRYWNSVKGDSDDPAILLIAERAKEQRVTLRELARRLGRKHQPLDLTLRSKRPKEANIRAALKALGIQSDWVWKFYKKAVSPRPTTDQLNSVHDNLILFSRDVSSWYTELSELLIEISRDGISRGCDYLQECESDAPLESVEAVKGLSEARACGRTFQKLNKNVIAALTQAHEELESCGVFAAANRAD